MSHLSGEVKRLMSTLTKYDQDNYPEMLGRICIINAPLVFKAIWALVKPLLNPRTLSKIQVGLLSKWGFARGPSVKPGGSVWQHHVHLNKLGLACDFNSIRCRMCVCLLHGYKV